MAWEPEQQSVKTRTSSFHDLIIQRRTIYGKEKCGRAVGEKNRGTVPHISHKGNVSICVFSWAQQSLPGGESCRITVSALAPGGMGQDGAAGLSKITQR